MLVMTQGPMSFMVFDRQPVLLDHHGGPHDGDRRFAATGGIEILVPING